MSNTLQLINKIAWLVFFFGLALFFFGFGFAYLEIAIGVAALILGIFHLM